MKDAVLTFACARPDLLQRHLRQQGVKKSAAEVDSFITTFIAALMSNGGAALTKQLRQLSPAAYTLLATSTSSTGRGSVPPLLLTLLTWNVMTKNSDGWARRLLQLNALHLQMVSRGALHLLDDLPQAPRGRLPAVWWSRECDVDLLLGIYKWGYRRFEEMREDKELCFRRIMDQLKDRRNPNDPAPPPSTTDGDPPPPAADEEEDEEGADEFNSEEEEEGEEDDDEDEDRPKKPKAKSSSSTPAASRPASPISRTLFGPVSKGKTEDGWPIALALVGRFRQLLKVMRLRDASEATEAAKRKAADPTRPMPPSKRQRRDLVAGWTDDELSVFTKLMLLIGAPLLPNPAGRWAHLRAELGTQAATVAVTRKTDEALTARLEGVQKEAKALLVPLNEPLMLETMHEQTLQLLTSLYTQPLAPTLRPALTPHVASLVQSHLRYFHLSRTVLATPPQTTPPAWTVSSVSPAWWKLALHDRYLVQAINAHGLRLKEIDEDLVFPFKMYGGLEGHLKTVGVSKGMEWIVERWKTLVDHWTAEKEKEAKAALGSAGGAGGRGKDEGRKEGRKDSKKSASSQQTASSKGEKPHR